MKLPELIMSVALIAAAADCWARAPGKADAMPPSTTQTDLDFARYDVDRNGVLSNAELLKHPMAAHAPMADANGDGHLDKAEFAALEAM